MAHLKETNEEFDARYEAYFNQPDKDNVDGKFVKLSMILEWILSLSLK